MKSNISLLEISFMDKLHAPNTTKLIKQFSNISHPPGPGLKCKSAKIKKVESLDTNTTEEYTMLA